MSENEKLGFDIWTEPYVIDLEVPPPGYVLAPLGPVKQSFRLIMDHRTVMEITEDGRLILDLKDSDEAAACLKEAWERIMGRRA